MSGDRLGGAEAGVGPDGAAPRAAERGRGVLLALLSAAGFSTLGLFAKLVYAEGFSPSQALAWRFLIAAAFLWIWVFVGRRPLPRPLAPVLLLGLVGFVPQAGLYFATVRILDPGITSLLLYLYPSFVVIIGLVFLRRRPGRARLAALALALAGSALTFWKRGEYPALGIGLGVLVAVAYAAYLVVGERVLERADPVAATALVMTVAALVYWGLALAEGPPRLPGSLRAAAGVVGIALLATVLPITTLFASMRLIGAADASLVSTLEPVLTVVLSYFFLGEALGPARLAGGACILAAVLVIDLAPRLARRAG